MMSATTGFREQFELELQAALGSLEEAERALDRLSITVNLHAPETYKSCVRLQFEVARRACRLLLKEGEYLDNPPITTQGVNAP